MPTTESEFEKVVKANVAAAYGGLGSNEFVEPILAAFNKAVETAVREIEQDKLEVILAQIESGATVGELARSLIIRLAALQQP